MVPTDSLEVYIALFTGQNTMCAFGYQNGNWCYGNVCVLLKKKDYEV